MKAQPTPIIIAVGGTAGTICSTISEKCSAAGAHSETAPQLLCIDTDGDALADLQQAAPAVHTLWLQDTLQMGDLEPERQNELSELFAELSRDGMSDARISNQLLFYTASDQQQLSQLDDLLLQQIGPQEGSSAVGLRKVWLVGSACGAAASSLLLPLAWYIRRFFREHNAAAQLQLKAVLLMPDLFYRRRFSSFQQQKQFKYSQEFMHELTKSPELFDFFFLYQEVNVDGRMLRDFDTCMQHIADTLLTVISPSVQPALDAYEKALLHERPRGRAIFAGFGSAVLEFPEADVFRYLSACEFQQQMEHFSVCAEWLQQQLATPEQPADDPAIALRVSALRSRMKPVQEFCSDDAEKMEAKYRDPAGVPKRFVCADPCCLRGIRQLAAEELQNTSAQLFRDLMLELLQTDCPDSETVAKLWAEKLRDAVRPVVPKDVLSALELEEKLKVQQVSEVRSYYAADTVLGVEHLAAPFIDLPIAQYQRELTCALYPEDDKEPTLAVSGKPEWALKLASAAKLLPDSLQSPQQLRILRLIYLPGALCSDFVS